MEQLIENLIAYALVFSIAVVIIFIYLRKNKRQSYQNYAKLKKAKETGLYESVDCVKCHPSEVKNGVKKTKFKGLSLSNARHVIVMCIKVLLVRIVNPFYR